MARLSSLLLLLGFLGTTLVAADFNETEQHINADCDNGCFFDSFPGGSCTNDPACMCDQQKYREAYFCCTGKNCAPSVMPDAIVRAKRDCAARNMPFTFDAEAVCGIALTTSTSTPVSTSATSTGSAKTTATTTSTETTSAASSTSTPATSSNGTSGSTSTASKTSTGSSKATPTANSASANNVMMNAVVGIVAASVILS